MLEKLKRIFGRGVQESIIVATVGGVSHEYPSVGFKDYIEAYEKDPDIAASVDFLTNQIVAPGFYTESDDPKAKELVDAFCAEVGMDELLFKVVKELVLAGNSFVRYDLDRRGRLQGLIHLKLSGIKRVQKDKNTNKPIAYIYSPDGSVEKRIPAEEIIHFAWNTIDGSVLGCGIARQLLEPRQITLDTGETVTVSSLLKHKWRMEWTMQRLLERYVSRFIYRFPGIPESVLKEKIIPYIQSLKPGQDFITNARELEVKQLKIDPRANFEAYINYLHNETLAGLRTPVVKLFTTPGFTEASARAAVEAAEHHVRAIQRYVKRVVENKIFRRLLEDYGFNWDESMVKLNWGLPERPEISLSDIFKASYPPSELYKPLISRREARSILRDMGWPLEPEEEEVAEFWKPVKRPKVMWIDTPKYVILQLVDPSQVDLSTIRYLTIDSEAGVRIAVAWVTGTNRRWPVAIYFDKSKKDWTLDLAKQWYRDSFPAVYWEKLPTILKILKKR